MFNALLNQKLLSFIHNRNGNEKASSLLPMREHFLVSEKSVTPALAATKRSASGEKNPSLKEKWHEVNEPENLGAPASRRRNG